ncbi:histidine kinase [Streptomyces sp. NPDC056437]|uniref:sensor histidine kinase n=1 Tax=Streptomyces sp. NPDC056437 TaxID=3345816 RepID=UPI0036C4256A
MNETLGRQQAGTLSKVGVSLARLAHRRTAWSAWIATTVVASLALLCAVFSRSTPRPDWHPWWLLAIEPVTSVLLAVPGLIVATRRPRNPAGWLLLSAGLWSATEFFTHAYALYAIPRELTGGAFALWATNWIFIPFNFSIIFLLLLFPDGRLPSGRWRTPAWCIGGCAVLGLPIGWFMPGPLSPGYFPAMTNPVGIPALAFTVTYVGFVAVLFLLCPFLLSAASLWFRFRQASQVTRQQIKWVAWAVLMSVLLVMAHILVLDAEAESIAIRLVPVVLSSAIAIAIVRHNLFDIDRILSNSLLYAALTGCVVGLYIGLVSLFGFLLQYFAPGVAPLMATGVIAVVLQPLRALLQRLVGRLVYGLRDDPYAALAGLGRRLEATIDPKQVLPEAAATVAQALRLPYVAIDLDDATAMGDARGPAAVYGRETPVALRLPLVHQGEEVGTLMAGARSVDERFSTADLRLLRDVARHIAQAAAGVRLSLALLRSQEQAVAVRAEERRRLARDLHDGIGPVLTGATWTLHAATTMLRDNPDGTRDLLDTAVIHLRQGTDDLRRISMGLRSPVDQLGLREAVLAYTDRVSLTVHTDLPREIPRLAAAVEEAAYWILVEAVANVLRHAEATNCWVRLHVDDTDLRMTITDDGSGLPPRMRPGVGVGTMRERAAEIGGTCDLRTPNDGGTQVVACLPIALPGAAELIEQSRSV